MLVRLNDKRDAGGNALIPTGSARRALTVLPPTPGGCPAGCAAAATAATSHPVAAAVATTTPAAATTTTTTTTATTTTTSAAATTATTTTTIATITLPLGGLPGRRRHPPARPLPAGVALHATTHRPWQVGWSLVNERSGVG